MPTLTPKLVKNQMLYGVPPAHVPLLPQAALHAYLFHGGCFTLYEHSARDVEKLWGISADEACALGVRSVPSLISNLLSSQSCVEKFGADVVAKTPGFYWFNRTGSICVCNEWTDLCVCDLPAWRLDIDFCWSRRGLLLPVIHNQSGWIVGIKVFRHPMDQRPFTLRVREARAA